MYTCANAASGGHRKSDRRWRADPAAQGVPCLSVPELANFYFICWIRFTNRRARLIQIPVYKMNHHSVSIIHIYFSLPLPYVVENSKIIKIADIALICLILYLLNSKKFTVKQFEQVKGPFLPTTTTICERYSHTI